MGPEFGKTLMGWVHLPFAGEPPASSTTYQKKSDKKRYVFCPTLWVARIERSVLKPIFRACQ
jgi:hypothetical protein